MTEVKIRIIYLTDITKTTLIDQVDRLRDSFGLGIRLAGNSRYSMFELP